MTRVHSPAQPATRIPAWVTVVDVLCLVVVAVLIRSMIADYRITLAPELRISMRSWPRIAVVLGAIIAARHLAWRTVPWHARVFMWLRAAWNWEPLRAAWAPFIISRVLVLTAGYIAVTTIGFNPRRPWRALGSDVLDLFARWDGGWYYTIAHSGYQDTSGIATEQSDIAFFPGLPLLMRAVGALLNINLWVAGIIVVVIAFLWGLTYVYRLARLDLPAEEARASVVFLAFYPFAVCYSAVLTEAVFLLAAAATFFHFRREEFWKAGAFGLLLGLVRPNGFLVAIPLALLALLPFMASRGWWRRPQTPGRSWTRLMTQLGVAALPIAGMLSYAAYLQVRTGDPFAFATAQQAWGRKTEELANIIDDRRRVIEGDGLAAYARDNPIEILEGSAALFALAAVWPIVRRFGLAYGVFVAMAIVPSLISLGSISLGRYSAPLFPLFIWLATVVPAERRPYVMVIFSSLQAVVATLFYTWRPPY